LYATTKGLLQMLVRARVTSHNCVTFSPTNIVASDATVVFASEHYGFFAILQSTLHNDWFVRFGSTLETRLRYTPSDCFETFPFPDSLDELEEIGARYYKRRSEIMFARTQGLTATYNRFHDPNNHDQDIKELHDLHVEMDYAVSASYGWKNLDLGHGFH